ncbi:hypothetical protein [Flavobacterium sp. Root420]|uniref:hypothetical protein n=1 Tax=Flavobacterium sp. Root420 TaxID=1736533 RepID=UPI0006F8768E|nr:hypothetical protein [Flavobacterium sp. Root420]KQX09909.1 hypothetical protein ASC72_21750 [Flavobacterium sp. Root420]
MKKTENISVSIISEKYYHNHKLELRIGDWKKHFDPNYVNTIIAMALNHCTEETDFIINGYLITSKNLYLVAKTDKKRFDEMLHKIEHHINLLLKFLTPEKNKYEIDFYIDQDDNYSIIHEPLFTVYPFKNDYLIRLITGKKVVLPYYNPELESLKSIVQHHPFCSVIDYSGAIGPVTVIPLKD